MKTLQIRDSMAVINNDKTVYEFPSGSIEIVGPDERALFAISLSRDGIEISACGVVQAGKEKLGDLIAVRPRAANVIHVFRLKY